MERETAQWKKEYVDDLNDIIKSNSIIGIVNIGGIPAPQLQKMRNELRGKMQLIVAKNNLLNRALEQMEKEKKGVSQLCELIDGQNALVGTKDNPFKLYKIMAATMTPAPAKGGETAPDDIDVAAGETPFKPGPIVGDLQKAGIPAAIEGGKVVIKKDKKLVKAGEPIPVDVAKMLTKLDIFPLTVGMDLRGAYEDGTVFKGDVLAIDEEKFTGDLHSAMSGGFNLACYIGYSTPLTINSLIIKASGDAMSVALFANITNKATIERLLDLASGRMLALASRIPDALDDDLKGVIGAAPAPEEPKPEVKKEEKPEKEEKEEATEEEMAAGMGTLFED
jgi:large subunit ribosomal protein L10